jgi:paraquat-inducible protein B
MAEIRKTLISIQNSLAVDSPLQQDLRQTLKETTRTAQSIRSLADTLDQEPESLLRGKTGDTP